jgi:hypothetical protein
MSVIGDPELQTLIDGLQARSEGEAPEMIRYFSARAEAGDLDWNRLDTEANRYLADKMVERWYLRQHRAVRGRIRGLLRVRARAGKPPADHHAAVHGRARVHRAGLGDDCDRSGRSTATAG